jgi:hypothetical protein
VDKPTQSFGEQAARVSLYAPIMALVLGVCTFGNRSEPGVANIIAVVNVFLIVAGFILGVVALISMRWYGRARILGRAVGGLLFNGVFIFSMVVLVLPYLTVGLTKSRVIGRWATHPDGHSNPIELILNNDLTFHFGGSASGIIVSLDGHWEMRPDRAIFLTIDHVESGSQSATGKQIGLGIVQTVNDQEMTLKTDNGQETYDRVR